MGQRKENLAGGRNPVIIGENKRMRFCLELILGVAVLGSLQAASLPAGNALPRAVWVVKVDTRTGKLVRTLAPAPRMTVEVPSVEPSPDVHGLVAEAAKAFDVNPLLVDSVIQVES